MQKWQLGSIILRRNQSQSFGVNFLYIWIWPKTIILYGHPNEPKCPKSCPLEDIGTWFKDQWIHSNNQNLFPNIFLVKLCKIDALHICINALVIGQVQLRFKIVFVPPPHCAQCYEVIFHFWRFNLRRKAQPISISIGKYPLLMLKTKASYIEK